MIGDSELAVRPDEFDECDREKAERELRETPEVVQESLKILCDMLAGQLHLFFFFFFGFPDVIFLSLCYSSYCGYLTKIILQLFG